MNTIARAAAQFTEEGIVCYPNEPLKNHTSFCIGGPAALFCVPQSQQQLLAAITIAKTTQLPYFLLGNGTNLLFDDAGYQGIVIRTANALSSLVVEGTDITAGAGVELSALCKLAQKNGLTGLEFAYGIPGGVGGALYMNAGAYGGEMCDVVTSVTYMDEEGKEQALSLADLQLGYRQSIFQQQPWCILSVRFSLAKGKSEQIQALMQQHMQSRLDKQPLDWPSAGSAFKRPQGAFAGALIDQCGLRGYRVGGAAISEKHCGFIVNLGGATSRDVQQLANDVANKVLKETGYILEKEIRVIESPHTK